jgi:hypothetical protein
VASRPGSPGAASSRPSDWAAIDTWWSARLVWLVGYRRLQVRYERRADILLGFLSLACALICLKSLNRSKRVKQPVGQPRRSCFPPTIGVDRVVVDWDIANSQA